MARMATRSKRRIRTKRRGKNQITIQDLNAWEQAYGHQLTNRRRFMKILPYVGSITAFTELLFVRLPVTITAFVLSTIFCWSAILSKETYVSYVRASYSERNRTINLLSQALSGGDATLFTALKQTIPAMHGELRHEFQILAGLLARSARNDELHDWFMNEISKYRDDVIFGQYLEQMETMNQEGVYTVSTFLNLAHYHNNLYQKQVEYINAKEQNRREVFTIVALVFALILVLAVMVDKWSGWVKLYAHSLFGEVVSCIFAFVYIMIVRSFVKYYYDESITTYGSDSKLRSILRNSRHTADKKIAKEAEKQMITLTLPNDKGSKKKPSKFRGLGKRKPMAKPQSAPMKSSGSGGFGN